MYYIAVEGYLAKNRDGTYGVTGEGSLLDNAAGMCRNYDVKTLYILYILYTYMHFNLSYCTVHSISNTFVSVCPLKSY